MSGEILDLDVAHCDDLVAAGITVAETTGIDHMRSAQAFAATCGALNGVVAR